MKFITCTAIAAVLVLSTAACRQQESAGNEAAATETAAADLSALNGTWKTDKASVKFAGKPDEFSLKDGTYNCTTCIPPLTVAADGAFHAVAGPALCRRDLGQGGGRQNHRNAQQEGRERGLFPDDEACRPTATR